MPRIVLIDDDSETLERLGAELRECIDISEVRVDLWQPRSSKGIEQLEELSEDTALVVTDLDLSISKSGIGGDTILRWCQRKALPAALYTRRPADESAIPDLFELRLPRGKPRGPYIAEVYRGFMAIRMAVSELNADPKASTLASVLAQILGRRELEYELAQYTTHLGEASGALTARVQQTAPAEAKPPVPSSEEKERVLTYVLGHLLLNAVIRYPGPLLTVAALCGYIGTTEEEADTLFDLFSEAIYRGPYHGLDRIYWRHRVEDILDTIMVESADYDVYTIRRRVVEEQIGRELSRHSCRRCSGVNGGFYCPFTMRAVCERGDCSTASNSWLPLGATACRIELEFFEEWAPLLRF